MSDTMKCDGCGATGRRGLGRIAPDGWLYLEAIDSDGETPTIIVFACSAECAAKPWRTGPGRLDLSDEMRDGRTSEQRLAAENAELRRFVEDLRDHGTRFDTTPSFGGSADPVVMKTHFTYQDYLKRMDESVRERAGEVLNAKR